MKYFYVKKIIEFIFIFNFYKLYKFKLSIIYNLKKIHKYIYIYKIIYYIELYMIFFCFKF